MTKCKVLHRGVNVLHMDYIQHLRQTSSKVVLPLPYSTWEWLAIFAEVMNGERNLGPKRDIHRESIAHIMYGATLDLASGH